MSLEKFNWTPASEAKLEDLWSRGLSFSEIAAKMGGGLSRSAAIGKARRMGLARGQASLDASRRRGGQLTGGYNAPRDWTPEEEATLTRLWGEGISLLQITEAMGVPYNTVKRKVRRMGLPARPKAPPKPRSEPTDTAAQAKARKDRVMRAHRAPDAGEPVAFDDLEPRHCRFEVTGATDAERMRFCGAERDGQRAYCAHHAAIAYVPFTGKKGRADPETQRAGILVFGK